MGTSLYILAAHPRAMKEFVEDLALVSRTLTVMPSLRQVSHLVSYYANQEAPLSSPGVINDFRLVSNVKVLPSEVCAPHHKLLVCDLQLKISKPLKKTSSSNDMSGNRRTWKLKLNL